MSIDLRKGDCPEKIKKTITHYDLFAGIGGFSLALDEVFYEHEIKHIFSEWEQFPTAILKKHWPDGTFYGDIRELIADTDSRRWDTQSRVSSIGSKGRDNNYVESSDFTIVTGGFPCQPFSVAGRRKGTADDRYLWPEMFAVIKNVRPDWVIAENVRGLSAWNDGLVLEQVCSDLESAGYETRTFIIPAVAVNAPHRRDRVWIVGHAEHTGQHGTKDRQGDTPRDDSNTTRQDKTEQFERPNTQGDRNANARNYPDWNRNWQEVAFATCNDTVDARLPRKLDGATERGKRTDQISAAKWRKESLKAYGNAIVPQVAMQIFRGIKETYFEIAKKRIEEIRS